MRDIPLFKISANSSHIWVERAQKPHKSGYFKDAALPQKHSKIYNLTTTNATLMKPTTIIYLHKTFNLAKDWSVTHKKESVRKHIPKISENEPQN